MRKRKKLLIAAAAMFCCLAALALYLFSRNTDFTGQRRLHLSGDVAYRTCRMLEEETGIQIFYLPEWTEKEDGFLHYSDFDRFRWDRAYFQDVLTELEKMREVFQLYPDGFLREVIEKKDGRSVQIVLCPYTYDGYTNYGRYVHDYSEDEEKVDGIYYTGQGDSQYYSHEIGHMILTAAAIQGGWGEFCGAWDDCGEGYVSDYARTSRPEDWAETWAWLWHQTDVVEERCREDGALLAKVRLMSALFEENYSTVTASELPWADLL